MFAPRLRRKGVAGRKRVLNPRKQQSKPAWQPNLGLYGICPYGPNSDVAFVAVKGEAPSETVDASPISFEAAPAAKPIDDSGPCSMAGVEAEIEVDYNSDDEPLVVLSKDVDMSASAAPKPKLSAAQQKAVQHLSSVLTATGLKPAKTTTEEKKEAEPPNLFVKAMTAPATTRTANGDIAFERTDNAVLDLFYSGFVRGTSEENVRRLFAASWKADPRRSLQTLFHARDVRNGKGERNVSLHALLWLRMNKPLTYIRNIRGIARNLGYYKDLCELAARATQLRLHPLGCRGLIELELLAEDLNRDWKRFREWSVDQEGPASEEGASAAAGEEETKEPTTDKKKKKKGLSLSLAAKWAPSESASSDVQSHLAERLAALMFPEEAKTAGRKKYRQLLSALRAHLQIVEAKMCAGQWKDINYESVPGKALQRSKAAFQKHDPEGYSSFIGEVKTGKKKVKVGGFDPVKMFEHIVQNLQLGDRLAADPDDEFGGWPLGFTHTETDELQWKELLDKLCSKAHLTRSISMVDVSGSMCSSSYTPLAAALMMGFATASASKDAFHGKVITFSAKPAFHEIQGETLKAQVKNMIAMDWTQNTNILAAFDLILKTAVDHNVPPEHMPQTLFIYSDMQFDQATKGSDFHHSSHQNMKTRFEKAGYEVPRIVYWNLIGNTTTAPVSNSEEEGVALLSGYSPQQLKMFTTTGEFNPMAILDQAIGKYCPDLDPSEI